MTSCGPRCRGREDSGILSNVTPMRYVEDVRQEKVSIEHALAEYGVVIDPDTREIDVTSTQEARRNARAARDDASAAS